MVKPARASSKAYHLRGSDKSFSTRTILIVSLGSCLLVLSYLSGTFFNEVSSSSHSNLRSGSSTGGVSSAETKNNNEHSNQDFFIPDAALHEENKWGKTFKPPKDWKRLGFHDLHSAYECSEHAYDQNKPMPDMEYWNYYRDTYKRVVNNNIEFDSVPPTEGYTMNEEGKQPYYAKLSPGKGRGLFASRDIKKGEMVHDGNASDVEMSANEWRKMALALPQKMACDFSEWTWTQQMEKGGPYKIFTAFNISILMNGSNKPNTMPKSSYSSVMYALRDIKKDEEILTDYKVYPTRWSKVGLG